MFPGRFGSVPIAANRLCIPRWFLPQRRCQNAITKGNALGSLPAKIFKKFRNWIDARNQQMVASSSAGNVQKMPFSVVQIFKVGMITDGSDAFLKWDDVVVAGDYADATKLESLCGVHRR